MHSLEDTQSNVPAFLIKLWKLVEDPASDHLIKWGSTETSFIIRNQAEFAKELLPLYFKHNNMASFIRQLNMYGFHKITNIMKSNMRSEDNEMEFHHPCFAKQRKELLPYIKRKTSSSTGKLEENIGNSSDTIQDILSNVKVLQVKQENVDSLLSALTQENEALWREIALLRQKHAKQQQIVAKLIEFLLTIVQSTNRRKILKRKLPLMIQEGKSTGDNQSVSQKIQKMDNVIPEEQSLTIRDVTHHLDNEALFSSSSNSALNSSTMQTPGNIKNSLVEFVDNSTFPILDSDINPTATLEELNVLEPFQTADNMIDPNEVDSQFLEVIEPEICSNEIIPDAYTEKAPLKFTVTFDNAMINEPTTCNNSVADETVCNNSLADEFEINNISLEADNASNEILRNDQKSVSSLESSVSKMENLSKSSFTEHLDHINNELNWLYDQLSAEQFDIDSSNLLSLFNADDNPSGYGLALDEWPGLESSEKAAGD